MVMFVPVPDEWDSGEAFAGEVLVPYHVGIPVWRDEQREQQKDADAAA
jgi:hypothetical protein